MGLPDILVHLLPCSMQAIGPFHEGKGAEFSSWLELNAVVEEQLEVESPVIQASPTDPMGILHSETALLLVCGILRV